MSSERVSDVGAHIARVREQAGLKQNELAQQITWSPAVLSRVESGERSVSREELLAILDAIGTPGAAALKTALARDWQVLESPALDHPDQDLLWEAELVARELAEVQQRPEIRSAFQRRLAALSEELREAALQLSRREYRIAFIGGIGIGKSTAICRVASLEISDPDRAAPVAVLEAGAGGITLCEVHVRTGPAVGIMVEPRGEEEIRADVVDFAEYIREGAPAITGESEAAEGTQQGVSREVERAIRNMAGLRVHRGRKDEQGRRLPSFDEARELAKTVASTRELVVEILARMALHRRDRRDIWHDAASSKDELVWLKETFEAINNGRHAGFTLPRRIEVIVTQPLLAATDVVLHLIDTKGIDGGALRADLAGHLDDPHTIPVLCSRFNDAPAEAAQRLLERARDGGVRGLETRGLLLVLPHSGEALEVKDEAGIRVGTAEEGYELKGEQVAMRLATLNLPLLEVGFFNAREDAPDTLRQLILGRVHAVQSDMQVRLRSVASSARAVLDNHEREQVQAVQRQAGRMLGASLGTIRTPVRVESHMHEDLLDALGRAHWSTVRAAIRREGQWSNLNYKHHLGYGTRRFAVLGCGGHVDGFTSMCKSLSANPDFSDARELISQAERTLRSEYDELLRRVEILGQTAYGQELRQDIAFWVECGSESGKGYKSRIVRRHAEWFNAEARGALEAELMAIIEREWHAALDRVIALLDLED